MHSSKSAGGLSDCPMNPDNLMPLEPRQQPSEGQPFELNKERQVSRIPKADPKDEDDKFWVYPSEQMFWNAMLRKGWKWENAVQGKDDPQGQKFTSKDMTDIIKIHNFNNNSCWRQIEHVSWCFYFHVL